MKSGLTLLKYKDVLKPVYLFSQKKKVKLYLVGGILRDILLGREKINPDIDFCLKKGSINFGKGLAKELKAGFVVLDKDHGACRLVKKYPDKTYTLDFMDFRGVSLKEDLLHRDFTINCMSLELKYALDKEGWREMLVDLYGARSDLKAKKIKIINNQSFDEDPLRILRAFSLAATFSFNIGNKTLNLARLKRKKLSSVSSERIRDELFKILEKPDSFAYLLKLDKSGILKVIIPEIEVMRGVRQGPYHHLDVWQHSLETLKQLENLMPQINRKLEIKNYLNQVISGERTRLSLVKFSAILHDIGKPSALRRQDEKITFHGHEKIGLDMARDITKRLKLSNDEINCLGKIILWHLRPGYLADNPDLTPRAKFRYFRDTALEAVSTLVLSLADQRATKGRLTSLQSRMHHEKVVFSLIREYFKKSQEKKTPRLINGDDLIRRFKLEPSPLIGKILSEIEELQAIGKIKTKKEALALAQRIFKL